MWRSLLLAGVALLPARVDRSRAHEAVAAHAFAAPEILLVTGGGPGERWVMPSIMDNMTLFSALGPRTPLPPGPPSGPRTALRVALFWGTGWHATAESPDRLRTLRPEQGTEGWFYPAAGAAPALVSFGGGYQVVSDAGLAVLRRYGVPTRLP